MKSIVVCALMISVVLGSMGGAQDEVTKRLQRADGTPTAVWATNDGSLINVEAIEGNRFSVYQGLGSLILYVKGNPIYGMGVFSEAGKLFIAKSENRAPYMESGMVGAMEVKEIQVKSQLWISPNGTKWRETIDNDGNITKVKVLP